MMWKLAKDDKEQPFYEKVTLLGYVVNNIVTKTLKIWKKYNFMVHTDEINNYMN